MSGEINFNLRNIMLKNKLFYIFIVTYIVYFAMIFITIPVLNNYSHWLAILDLMPFWYDLEYAKNLLNALWEEWKNYYLTKQLVLDLFYPWLFAYSYFSLLKIMYSKIITNKKIVSLISISAVIWWWFDYSENFIFYKIFSHYPFDISNLVFIWNIFSISKTIFSSIAILGVIVWIGILGVKKWEKILS